MRRMGRLLFVLLVVGGGVLAWNGWADHALSRGSADAPEPISATELAQGLPDNRWRTLGPHEPVVRLAMLATKNEGVEYVYYPIVDEAEWAAANAGPLAKYGGDVIGMPVAELTAAIDVCVLVKTRRYRSEAALNQDYAARTWPRKDVTGLVVGKASGLNKAERETIQSTLGRFDPERVVILEEGREPNPPWRGLAMMIGGALLALGGLAIRVRSWRRSNA